MSKPTKRGIIGFLGEAEGEALTMSAIAAGLDIGRGERGRLRELLTELEESGKIERTGRRYTKGKTREPKKRRARSRPASGTGPIASGVIRVHPAGYGFVERDDGLGDVFVPAKYRGNSMDGDNVVLYTWDGYRGTEGRVDEVLSRGRAKLTGVLRRSGRGWYLEPDDPRIATDHGYVGLEGDTGGAHEGQCVLIDIVEYPGDTQAGMYGRVTQVLGEPEDPTTEIAKIVACGGLPDEFPEEALAQAKRTSQSVDTNDLADRIDLRDRRFMTIDPTTARDFDDALCVEDGPHGGARVWVAVADVSHYVRPGDALDLEAQVRGVSVYFPDQVIPMLPFELSSEICSLKPDVDRCAMVVRLDFDSQFNVVETGFAAAVIRSRARLDYENAAAALEGDFRGPRGRYRPFAEELGRLSSIAQALRKRRQVRGALELHLSEPKIVLDADDPRLVRDVVRAKGNEQVRGAYQLVEEFMVAANEAVGRFFEQRGIDSVYRVHAPPDEDRLEELARVMSAFRIDVDVHAATRPQGVQDVLRKLRGHPAEMPLSFYVLRTLSKATYQVENVGHFGLASKQYIHFTSPIRRYPDLLVHRLMKSSLHREGSPAGQPTWEDPMGPELAELARLCSSHERRATEAEREVVAMYRANFMRDHVGEEFPGRVIAVTNFGAFVEINEPFVEGLLRNDSMGQGRVTLDDKTLRLSSKSGMSMGLGDSLTVEVVEASVLKRQISLRLAGIDESAVVESAPKRRASASPRSRAKAKPRAKARSKASTPTRRRKTKSKRR